MNNDFKGAITEIFKALDENENKDLNSIVNKAIASAKQSKIDISNPEEYDLFIVQPVNRVLKLMSKGLRDNKFEKNKSKANSVYLKYDFLSGHIENLCDLKDGSSCRADKSRYILNAYLEYCITGEIPSLDMESDHYWIPKFGDTKLWMEFCDSLLHMYHGYPEEYLKCYKKLIDAERRTYRHLLRTWFAKLTNGVTIKIGNSWDDNLENPLEKSKEDDFYRIHKRKVPKELELEVYVPDEDDFLIRNNYLKLPESLVEKIYYETEEKYI